MAQIFDDIEVWMATDSPAINADPMTFAEYLRDQAGYYASLDTEYSHKVAEMMIAQAEMAEFAARSRDLREDLKFQR